jgi:ubiquinone/menaquinone biosynthesis C-methylase UbiE
MAAIVKRTASFTARIEKLRTWLLSQQWFTSFLFRIPRSVRWFLRSLYFAPLDIADSILGRKDPMTPPRRINFTGAVTNLEDSREELKQNLIKMAGLEPTSRVLELGCGFGRLGIPLTRYLDRDGAYHGIDIVPKAIQWCQEKIKGPHGNISFIHADVKNGEYNPRGRIAAVEYCFPFADETFDLVVLISVFTHMLPREVEHYLAEIARVLKPGGRCYVTYFLVTEESRSLMTTDRSSLKFEHNYGDYWIMNKEVPELGVGYDEKYVRELHAKHGLSVKLYPGKWSIGFDPGDQDVVVGYKAVC